MKECALCGCEVRGSDLHLVWHLNLDHGAEWGDSPEYRLVRDARDAERERVRLGVATDEEQHRTAEIIRDALESLARREGAKEVSP